MNVLLINAAALVTLLLCMAVYVRSIGKMSRSEPSLRSDLFLFALSASAVMAIFAEALGDTLQIAMLGFLLVLWAARRFSHPWVRLSLSFAALVLCFFIHEASVFLLAPSLPFLLKPRPKIRDFVFPIAALAALLALSIHWSVLESHLTYEAILYPRGLQLAQPLGTPSFRALFLYEYRSNFNSRDAFFAFAGRIFRILLLAVAALAALYQCLARDGFRRTLRALAVILLVSSPLWLIAHDWGRFLAYAFFLAISSSGLWPSAAESSPPVERVDERFFRLSGSDLLQFAILLALFNSPDQYSRVEGLSIQDAEIFCLVALVSALAWLSRKAHGAGPRAGTA